jgi:hypothetical protein
MKISFDGLRRNIAWEFNNLAAELAIIPLDQPIMPSHLERIKRFANELRGSIGGMLCCYDENQQPEDFNDLSDLELEEL